MLPNGKKIRLFSAIFFIIFSFFLFLSPAMAAPYKNYGLDDSLKQGEVGAALIKDTPQTMAGTIVSAVLSLLGVIFFLLILYGGIRWMIAQGNESEVEKAKQIIIAAVSGLVIVLAAYAITAFIGEQLGLNK